jgi:hypothetical protein
VHEFDELEGVYSTASHGMSLGPGFDASIVRERFGKTRPSPVKAISNRHLVIVDPYRQSPSETAKSEHKQTAAHQDDNDQRDDQARVGSNIGSDQPVKKFNDFIKQQNGRYDSAYYT